jgi:hypothetical protein
MWEILIFNVISAAENSNKFQKTRFFWEEKSIEDVVTLGPTAQATLVYLKCNRESLNPPLEKSANKLLTKNNYVG